MRLIILFVAIALAAGVFFVAMHFTAPKEETPLPVVKAEVKYEKEPTVNVYTAREDIPIGSVLKQEMLDIQPWPSHLMLPDMVAADPTQAPTIVKMIVRTPFQKGEPIIINKLANEKDPSFFAAALPKGMRAVTISVDVISGVGGFVFPGDRVDVLITHDVTPPSLSALSRMLSNAGSNNREAANEGASAMNGEAQEGNSPETHKSGSSTVTIVQKDPITEVLLSNVAVLAINQKSATHEGEMPAVPSNVSLQVSAADAQKLRLAENGNGRLSLALRSLKDRDETTAPRPTGIGDLSHLLPPSYFPVLYDESGHPIYAEGANLPEEESSYSNMVVVVRGVQVQPVEVSRP